MPGPGRVLAARWLLRGGLALLLSGLLLSGFHLLTFGDPDRAREYADSTVESLSNEIDSIHDAMAALAASQTAREALDGDAGAIDRLDEALRGRGVAGIMEVRTFDPQTENIALGTYPEPDFGVIEMLNEARRQDSARARVHYHGTGDENLAFAEAIRDEEGESIIGILFARFDTDRLARSVARPGGAGWLRLVQGDSVLVERAEGEPAEAGGFRLVIPGSALVVEWGTLRSSGPVSLTQSLLVAGLGLVLCAAAVVIPRLPQRRQRQPSVAQTRPSRAASPPREMPADRPQPADDHRPSGVGRAGAGEPDEKSPPADQEPRPDLPDWMLEERAAARQDSPFGTPPGASSRGEPEAGAEPAAEPAPDADGEAGAEDSGEALDVPDLDEIFAEIERQSTSGEEEAEGDSAPDDASQAVAREPADDPDEAGAELGPEFELEPDVLSGSQEIESTSGEEALADEEFELGAPLELETDRELPVNSGAEDPQKEGETEDFEQPDWGAELVSDSSLEDSGEQVDRERPGSESAARDEPEVSEEDWQELLDEIAPGGELGAGDAHREQPASPSRSGAGEAADADRVETLESGESAEPAREEEAAGSAARVGNEETADAQRIAAARFAPELFKDDAIRGKADEMLDVDRAAILGRAIGTLAAQRGHGRFAVARDSRFSGPVLLSAVIRGLRESGMDVIELGAVPTPLAWFGAAELADGCAVMVTASHHGADENGFLVMIGGDRLVGRELIAVDEIAASGEFARGEGAYDQHDIVEQYTTRFSAEVQFERPLKVVVDCANGIAGSVAPALLEAAGADVVPLYCDVDGAFPNHPPDPAVEENLEDLRLCVRNFQADAGVAFDGDGDALTIIAPDGRRVRGDELLMLLAGSVLVDGATAVVDGRCPTRTRRWIEESGGEVVVRPAGAGRIACAVRSEQAALGLALDTTLIVADRWYPFEDALHAAARVLDLFARHDDVSAVLETLPEQRVTPELVLPVPSGEAGTLIERLANQGDFGDAGRETIEGLRISHSDRWALIRALPGGDRAGLSFGADSAEGLKRIKDEFREQLLAVDPELALPY